MRKPAVVAGRHQGRFRRFGACGAAAIRLMVAPGTHADAELLTDARRPRLPLLRQSQVLDFKGD